MARPLRIEFEGALYHVMARGNARADIFLCDADRQAFIENLERVCERFDWRVWAWCQMTNHYHLLVETLRPTLSKGMREVNGVYTQGFNRRHGRAGHVLQGRYKAVLVQKETHLLELSRYVVLNPEGFGVRSCFMRSDLLGFWREISRQVPMARPLRIEFEGALYHVMARGNARADIFLCDTDRQAFIDNLERVCKRFDWRVWAWCQMTNHYHLLVETLRPTLSKGMREVNGVYTQGFNRRHGRVGHVLQGRYKAVLVQKETHLLELSRYVVLNPVQAGMVEAAGDWPWSSYRAVMGKAPAPDWLAVDETLHLFHTKRGPARRAFARFVADGVDADEPFDQMPRPGFLGSESFVETILDKFDNASVSTEVPKQLRPARSLEQIAREAADRDRAITEAYRTGAYTLTEIARHFGIHQSTASRIARRNNNA